MNEATKVEVSTEKGKKVEVSTQTVSEAKKILKTEGQAPLIAGFRNETVILPLAILQRKVDQGFETISNGLQEISKSNMQSLNYLLQVVGGVQNSIGETRRTVAALARVLNVSQESLDAEVEKIRNEEATLQEAAQDEQQKRITVDREAQAGDTVKISYVGTIDGEEFEGGTAKGYHLQLGSQTFIAGFEDQLIGSKAGDTKEVNTKFPNTYGNKKLAGKDAKFIVNVHAVKELQQIEEDLSGNDEGSSEE